MRRTELLQEIRKMRFEEAYAGWNEGRLTQAEAGLLLGVVAASTRLPHRDRHVFFSDSRQLQRQFSEPSEQLFTQLYRVFRRQQAGRNIKHGSCSHFTRT